MLVTASPRNWVLIRRRTTLPDMVPVDLSKSLLHAPLQMPRPWRALEKQIALSLRLETTNGKVPVAHLVSGLT